MFVVFPTKLRVLVEKMCADETKEAISPGRLQFGSFVLLSIP